MAGARPLEGIRVVDFSAIMAGPYCTRLLGDLGADVIKIEPPDGEYMRARSPMRNGCSRYFGQLNCGKRSLAVDIKTADGVAIVKELAAASDVVVENFRPGVMERLGLGFDTLRALNPRLVCCSISGFGQAGPDADKPAYAPIVHATSGYDLAQLGFDGASRPAKTGIFTADVLAGLNAFGAIVTALFARERTGGGQSIDVTLIESMLNLLVFEVQAAQCDDEQRRPLYAPLPASDGFIVIAAITSANFANLADAVGHPEWKTDERFATPRAREQHWDAALDMLEAWTSRRTAQECEDELCRARVPMSRYRSMREVLRDPGLAYRGSFVPVEDGGGAFLVPHAPFRFSDASVGPWPFVPGIGEHGREILSDVLGYEPARIDGLMRAGTVAAPAARG